MDLPNAARPNKRRGRPRWPPRRHRINLSPDMLANIHGRLSCLDRLAFASVFRECRDLFKPEAPWLVLPGETPEDATLFSLADRRAGAVRAPDPALRGYAVLGSSRGWLANADAHGYRKPHGTFVLIAEQMRSYLYRKVVLSDSPASGGLGTAMLIMGPWFGVAAFATKEDATWTLVPSRDGVEDAIHHDGRFYSVTYSGAVEVWEHDTDTGVFTSATVTPSLDVGGDPAYPRKYLVAAPGGQLMVVLKESKETRDERNRCRWASSFKVQVLDGGQWKETDDIGDAALFVGANESLFMSRAVHPEIKPGHVYYTEDELPRVAPCNDRHREDDDRQVAWVFCLKDGTEENVEGIRLHRSWPPPAWFTPAIP